MSPKRKHEKNLTLVQWDMEIVKKAFTKLCRNGIAYGIIPNLSNIIEFVYQIHHIILINILINFNLY